MVVAGGRGMASLRALHPSSGDEWPAGVASSGKRMALCLVASFRWETNGAARGCILRPVGGVDARLEARRARRGGVVGRGGRDSGSVCRFIGSWVSGYAGETAGESRTPVLAGVIDGGAFRRRFLVGGIDVASYLAFPNVFRRKLLI